MVIWDYFMRRKWLLLTVLAVFLLSGTVSGYFLQHSDTYLVDSTVLNQPDGIEDAGDSVARVQVPILSEEEADALSVAESTGDDSAEIAMVDEITEAAVAEEIASNEIIEAPQTDPREIDVPLTNSSQADVNEAWRTLFATWQHATWSIFGIIVLALAVVLLARWSFWRKIR